jgi:hypothetical protein
VQREIRKKCDFVDRATLDDVLRVSLDDVVGVLDRRDRANPESALELVDRDVREADVANLSLMAKLRERPDGLLQRHARIGSVKLVQVDPVEA